MRALARGGPMAFDARLARAEGLGRIAAAGAPLAFLTTTLRHQRRRAEAPEIREAAGSAARDLVGRRLGGVAPWMALEETAAAVAEETTRAILRIGADRVVPAPVTSAGRSLAGGPPGELRSMVSAWLDDPSLLEPALGLWIRIGAAPILERAAAGVRTASREEWSGAACPLCGDLPQCSAIVEESDGLLQGAPRYLLCGRCASWWPFPRATCPSCGEDDSRRLGPYVSETWPWARVDACDTCHAYTKTFDLRRPDAEAVVPLVDDVATAALDLWAIGAGLHRALPSTAGV